MENKKVEYTKLTEEDFNKLEAHHQKTDLSFLVSFLTLTFALGALFFHIIAPRLPIPFGISMLIPFLLMASFYLSYLRDKARINLKKDLDEKLKYLKTAHVEEIVRIGRKAAVGIENTMFKLHNCDIKEISLEVDRNVGVTKGDLIEFELLKNSNIALNLVNYTPSNILLDCNNCSAKISSNDKRCKACGIIQ